MCKPGVTWSSEFAEGILAGTVETCSRIWITDPAAQDVSLEINLSIHIRTSSNNVFFTFECASVFIYCVTHATFTKFSSFWRKHLEKETDMVSLGGGAEE